MSRNSFINRLSPHTFTLVLLCCNSLQSSELPATLPLKVEDGVIFDAWGWQLSNIQSNLKNIADAGYNAIEISPIQGRKAGSEWYMFYQPTNFKIGNDLGDQQALESLCSIAKNQYGIKIIMDAVLNQCADDYPNSAISPQMDQIIKNNQQWWFHRRSDGQFTPKVSSWADRGSVTQDRIGNAADFNTQNVDLQNVMLQFLNECIASGVSGIRFDAAKSIETTRGDDANHPEYNGSENNFWDRILPRLTNKANLFLYGEILADSGDNNKGYQELFRTATGRSVNQANDAISNEDVRDMRGIHHYVDSIPAHNYDEDHNKTVVYIENWDNYTGSVGLNTNISSQSVFTDARARVLGNAMLTPRAYMVNIVFSRPGDTAPFDPMLVAVNKFRNAMVGQGEYVRIPSNNIFMVERGNKGAVLVNVAHETQWVKTATNLVAGSYTDKGSTNATFQVSNGVLTGNMPGRSAVTLYNASTGFQSNYPTMYLRGTMNNWGKTSMTLVADNTWQVKVSLSASTPYSYKFDATGTWVSNSNWGASTTAGVATTGGPNIPFTTGNAPEYTFQFNDSTLAYNVTKASLGN